VDFGFKSENYYDVSENYSDVSNWNSTVHHQTYGFAPEKIIFHKLNQTAAALLEEKSQTAPIQAAVQEIDAYYAILAEEQIRQNKNHDNYFADTDNWLDEYRELAELETMWNA